MPWIPKPGQFSVAAAVLLGTALTIATFVLTHVQPKFELVGEMIIGLLAALSMGCTAGLISLARELSKSRDEVLEVSQHDPLTGLLNRGAVTKELQQLPALPGSHAVLMADIDGLKRINDLYGHVAGDQVLLAVAEGLAQRGAMVGRYGGDEFLSILKNVSRRDAEDYRDNVMSALRNARVLESVTGDPIVVHASLGIAMFPGEANKIEDLLSLSDEAMYAVKRQRPVGRDTNRRKYELNVERLAGILGVFAPLLSDADALGDKVDGLAHRLLTGTGSECIVVTLWPRHDAVPVVRSAFASTSKGLEPQLNSYFETLSYDEKPIWQQLRRSGRSLVISNLEADERLTDSDRELARAAGMRSALLVPLNGPDGIIGALYVGSRREDSFGPADVQFFNAVAEHLLAVTHTSFLLDEIREGAVRLAEEHEATVMQLAAAAEAHDPAVGPHQSRVRQIAELIARELGLSPADAHQLGLAAALHDVGKLYVAESLLASTAVLTTEEKRQFQKHTVLGARFLDGSGTELAAVVARSHHERWDGGGYPDGLRAEEIPEAARIVTVADALDAMTHDRSYQQHRSLSNAVEEISAQAGNQFSPQVVEALLSLYERGVLDDLLSLESGHMEKAA